MFVADLKLRSTAYTVWKHMCCSHVLTPPCLHRPPYPLVCILAETKFAFDAIISSGMLNTKKYDMYVYFEL